MTVTTIKAHVLIVTSNPYPPVPVRCWDWQAHFDEYDGAPDAGHQCSGAGTTELAAVQELYDDYEGWFGEEGDPIPNPLCAHRPMFKEDLSVTIFLLKDHSRYLRGDIHV